MLLVWCAFLITLIELIIYLLGWTCSTLLPFSKNWFRRRKGVSGDLPVGGRPSSLHLSSSGLNQNLNSKNINYVILLIELRCFFFLGRQQTDICWMGYLNTQIQLTLLIWFKYSIICSYWYAKCSITVPDSHVNLFPLRCCLDTSVMQHGGTCQNSSSHNSYMEDKLHGFGKIPLKSDGLKMMSSIWLWNIWCSH